MLQTLLPICDISSVSHNLWDHWTAWCIAVLWRGTENQTRELAIFHVQVELLMQDEDDVSPRLSPPLPTDLLHQEAADASGFVRASQEIEKASQEAVPEKEVSNAAHHLPGMVNFCFSLFQASFSCITSTRIDYCTSSTGPCSLQRCIYSMAWKISPVLSRLPVTLSPE